MEKNKNYNEKNIELKTLLNDINSEIAIINCNISDDYTLNYGNPGFYKLIGYSPEQFKDDCKDSIRKIIFHEDAKQLNENTKLQTVNVKHSSQTYRIIKHNGDVIWVLEKGTRVEHDDKINFCGILTDVTEETESRRLLIEKNEELLISEKRYQIAMENSNEAIFDYDIAGKRIVFAKAAASKLNLPHVLENAVEAIKVNGIINKDSIENIKKLIAKIEKGVPTAHTEITASFKNGTEMIFEVFVKNIYDNKKQPVNAVGIIRNISEKKMLEKERQYRMAMTSDKVYANEVNFTKDTITDTNDSWAKIVGIPDFASITEMVAYMCKNLVHTSYEETFRNFFNKNKVEESLKNGRTQVVVEYRRRNGNGSYNWIENTMNIIRDEVTGDIKARLYICVINERKEREIKAKEEQFFYESMMSSSVNVYEANLTKNIFIKGNDFWKEMFGLEMNNNFSEVIADMTDKIIYPEDVAMVRESLYRKPLLDSFAKGTSEFNIEFRRMKTQGEYAWVSCAVHLFEDPETSDIKVFSYVQDINEKKLKEIELLYKAEHDTLTDYYNKDTTERLITEYLKSDEGKTTKHAFIIFDIDRFKSVNDTFGHIFGDVILSKVSQKTKELFRDDDILGRIGGDEFVVLVKNISTYKSALSRAKEICNSIRETYTVDNKDFVISASVGIAFYTIDGSTYKELYRNSDIALYQAKENGRDRYCVYNKAMTSNSTSIKQIDDTSLIEGKSFENNISDYVFRILYESCDKNLAINSVLELVGKHYGASRAYVFENFKNGKIMSNTFEWCSKGIPHLRDIMQNVSYENTEDYISRFDKTGVLLIKSPEEIPKSIEKVFKQRDIIVSIQFKIINNEMFSGFVGFDQCTKNYRELTKKDITDMRSIANILGVFIGEMRGVAYSNSVRQMAAAIVNSFDTYAYAINAEDYRLLFANDKMKKMFPNLDIADCCYAAIHNRTKPCDECVINNKNDTEVYVKSIDKWLNTSTCSINWVGDIDAKLVMAIDVTKYKGIS